MQKFENKSFYFVSDSNLTNPYYLEYLRSACKKTGKKVFFRNKGVPGARMDMVQNCIEEELVVEKPDYVALSFGVNDLGIWLYDTTLEVTEELQKQRNERIANYLCALEENIVYLQARGITPILMTPICVDENVVEKEEVQTDKDSKEKAAIKNTLFTKKSFQSINDVGLKTLHEQGMLIAKQYGVEIWDLYLATKAQLDTSCFYSDGVHYNEKGHRIIAQEIYKNMFNEELCNCEVGEEVKELSTIEADERAYFFVKYNLVFLSQGKKEGESLLTAVREFIEKKGYVEGLTSARAEGFFRFMENPVEKQKEIVRAIRACVADVKTV